MIRSRFAFVAAIYLITFALGGALVTIAKIKSPPPKPPSTQPSDADPRGGPFRDIDLVVPVL